ncbi:hypothetical protein SALBM217S_06103 [Streptomyces griseoloalbus]
MLDADLVVVDVNQMYLSVSGRTREELIGRHLFDVYPDNPEDPAADGIRDLAASLQRVLRSKEPDALAAQRYDLAVWPGASARRRRRSANRNNPATSASSSAVCSSPSDSRATPDVDRS